MAGCASRIDLGNFREVLHVGAKDDGFAVDGRLEDVVSALIDEAAAHKDDGRDLKDVRELANRIEDDDIRTRLRVDGQFGAPNDAKPFATRECFRFGEPFGLARRDDQQRVRLRTPDGRNRHVNSAS